MGVGCQCILKQEKLIMHLTDVVLVDDLLIILWITSLEAWSYAGKSGESVSEWTIYKKKQEGKPCWIILII